MSRWTLGPGRTLMRDDKAVFELSRVNLGNGTYATNPWEADDIARTIVKLLNATEPGHRELDLAKEGEGNS